MKKIIQKLENSKMKVLSWNINTFIGVNSEFKNIVSYILDINPDILCLQECNEEIIDILKNNWIFVGKTKTHGGWCSTFSKFQATDIVIYDKIGIQCKINNVVIGNCHLAPYACNTPFRKYQLQNFNDVDILCGDMNDQEHIMHPNYINAVNFDTWFLKYFDSTKNITKKYDHVYHTKAFDITVNSIYNGYSDHSPIVFTVLLKCI